MAGMAGSGNAIIDAMARIIWGMSWATAAEEAGVSLSGAKIEEVMPPVPQAAIVDAARLAGMIEQRNGAGLHTLLYKAARADAPGNEAKAEELFGDPDYEERFGECLAYQGTGHGVSWTDDHEEFGLEVPLFEPVMTVEAAEAAFADEAPTRRPS